VLARRRDRTRSDRRGDGKSRHPSRKGDLRQGARVRERVHSPLRVLRPLSASDRRGVGVRCRGAHLQKARASSADLLDEALRHLVARWRAIIARAVPRRSAVLVRARWGRCSTSRAIRSSTRSARAGSTAHLCRDRVRGLARHARRRDRNDSNQMVGQRAVVLWGINAGTPRST